MLLNGFFMSLDLVEFAVACETINHLLCGWMIKKLPQNTFSVLEYECQGHMQKGKKKQNGKKTK